MASFRPQHLEDDIISMTTLSDDEDNGIPNLLTSCDASTFTYQSIDPPTGDETEFQRNGTFKNSPYFSYRERYHGNGAEVHPTQTFNRQYTNPDRHNGRKPDPEPYSTPDNSDEDDDLFQLARRMSNTCGIEDTSSIEGPNDEEYWMSSKSNRKHIGGNGDGNIMIDNERRDHQRSRGMESYHEHNGGEMNFTHSISKESKMKGNFRSSPRKKDSKYDDYSPEEASSPRRYLGPKERTSSRSMSRGSKRSCRSSNGSISSKDSRHSSRSGSSSRRGRQKHAPKLTVEEAVAFLNGKHQMVKSPSLSSMKSYNSRKSSSSRMSTVSRTSKSQKSKTSVGSCDPKAKKNTVMKVVSAANALKGKLRRRMVSEKTFICSDDESSCFGS